MLKEISLSAKQTEAWDLLLEKNGIEEVFLGGAAGPGKTWLGCLWQITQRLRYPGTRGGIGRKTLKSIKDTTLMSFFEVAGMLGLAPGKDFNYNQQLNRITFDNGSLIYLVEMAHKPTDPDYHRFGSLELTDFFGDETPECPEKAVDIISSRIRYKLINGEAKALFCGNPAPNWSKLRWISDKHNKIVRLKDHQAVIRAVLSDNPDPEFREAYRKRLLRLPAYQRARLLDGNWEVMENDQPFFNFDPSRHVNFVDAPRLAASRMDPLWFGFDFNVDPTVALVAQKINRPAIKGGGLRFFREHTIVGGTEALCNDLLITGYKKRAGPLFIAGDFSGNTRNTAAKNTDYEIIAKRLMLPQSSFKDTRVANKDHVYSRGLCQYVLMHVPCQFEQGTNPQLIIDLGSAQATDDGKLRKDRDSFKMDHADAFRYLIDAWFPGGIEDVDNYLRILGLGHSLIG